jgi:hypothetical protein
VLPDTFSHSLCTIRSVAGHFQSQPVHNTQCCRTPLVTACAQYELFHFYISNVAKGKPIEVSGRKKGRGRLLRRSRGPQDPHSCRELSHISPSRDQTAWPHPALGLRPAFFLYTPTPPPPKAKRGVTPFLQPAGDRNLFKIYHLFLIDFP